METKIIKQKKWIGFRVKPDEYDQIQRLFKKSTDRKLSEYARKVLLKKPVKINYRNQSANDFLEEMILLKKELNAIGNNLNQSVKRLHSLDSLPEIKIWLQHNEAIRQSFMKKVEEIRLRMNQLYEQWSQK
jgi:hypothetical protein